jgi:uncharacterized radical SAM superfamily Fe-S cluster-containing enzyme
MHQSSIPFYDHIILHLYEYTTLKKTHSFVDGHLGCLHFLDTMNYDTVSVHVQFLM